MWVLHSSQIIWVEGPFKSVGLAFGIKLRSWRYFPIQTVLLRFAQFYWLDLYHMVLPVRQILSKDSFMQSEFSSVQKNTAVQ